jgi:hypothetical protein
MPGGYLATFVGDSDVRRKSVEIHTRISISAKVHITAVNKPTRTPIFTVAIRTVRPYTDSP